MKYKEHPYDKWKEEYMAKQLAKELEAAKIANPCVRNFGPGPEGAKCGTCKRLVFTQYTSKYYKCTERKITRGLATDHKVGWDACAKYEKKPQTKGESNGSIHSD